MASAALLSQIQSGRALKKAVTNDRSAPKVDDVKPSVGAGGGGRGGSTMSNGSSSVGGGGGGGSGPPQLAGLFAGGMPKLKPPSSSAQGKPRRDVVSTLDLKHVPSASIANLAKVPAIPKSMPNRKVSAPSHAPPAPPQPPSAPPSVITRTVPPPPSRTTHGPGRAVPPPPATSSSTITRAVPPPPSRSTTTPAHPPAPSLPARSVPAPPTSPPPSAGGRAVPPPPSRTFPPPTPSSTTVEAPNSAIHSVYGGRTPTSANGRDSPVSTPMRSVPPPPSSSGRKVPPPPPPRGGGAHAHNGSMSDTGTTPRRLAPPPPPARPLSAAGPTTAPPSHAPPSSAPPSRNIPPPTRHAPPPIRTAPNPSSPAIPSRDRTRVQSAVTPTSAASDVELENAIISRISQDSNRSNGVGMGPPPGPPPRRGPPNGSGAAPVLPALDLGGHGRTGSWSRATSGAPPRSSSYGGTNVRTAMADSGSSKRSKYFLVKIVILY